MLSGRAVIAVSGLTGQQDLWSEVGKILLNSAGADLVAFDEIGADGKVSISHLTVSENRSNPKYIYTADTIREMVQTCAESSGKIKSAVS